MNKKSKKTFKVAITVGGYIASVPLGAGLAYGGIKVAQLVNEAKAKKEYGDVWDYYLKTEWGHPVKLPIYNNTVAVMFDGFTEEAKNNAKYAISKLDDVLKTQEFTIYDNVNKPQDSNYIKISVVEEVDSENESINKQTIGRTYINYNEHTGYMIYPVKIEIEKRFVDSYNYGEEKSEESSVFSKIVQHELGHALGLKDLYDKQHFGKSIMFWSTSGSTQSYSALDTHNLRYVYDRQNDVSYQVTVTTPKQTELLSYYPQNKRHEDDTLSM